ncbi:hypothetical protein [Pseudoalteromonas piscicida]|uniref:hypothetical protein n=1 Tax=Pseudoalteromonas piscicida TaxID=43662 RepID=UPI0030B7DB77
MRINLLIVFTVVANALFSTACVGKDSIKIQHNIQHDVKKGDFVHVYTEIDSVVNGDLIFQFNVDEAYCQPVKQNNEVKRYPFSGSASSTNYVNKTLSIHKSLSLAAYQVAWPCNNLKMFIIEKSSKRILSTYLIDEAKNDSAIFNEKFYASVVVNDYIRGELLIVNNTNEEIEITNIDIAPNCKTLKKLGNMIYSFEIGNKSLKPSELLYVIQESEINDSQSIISSCNPRASYDSIRNGEVKKHILEATSIGRIMPREKVKMY